MGETARWSKRWCGDLLVVVSGSSDWSRDGGWYGEEVLEKGEDDDSICDCVLTSNSLSLSLCLKCGRRWEMSLLIIEITGRWVIMVGSLGESHVTGNKAKEE